MAITATRIASASRKPRLNKAIARADISASIGVFIFALRASGLLRPDSAPWPSDFSAAEDFEPAPAAFDDDLAGLRVLPLLALDALAAARFFRGLRFCETALVVNDYPVCGNSLTGILLA